MTVYKKPFLYLVTGLAALLFFLPCAVFAAPPITSEIRRDISKTMDAEKSIQNLKSEWKDESRNLADRLELLEQEAAALETKLERQTLRLSLEKKK
ncbi:MAG: hypothetical protein CSA25_00300, partial [Desulfobacter postgatei]